MIIKSLQNSTDSNPSNTLPQIQQRNISLGMGEGYRQIQQDKGKQFDACLDITFEGQLIKIKTKLNLKNLISSPENILSNHDFYNLYRPTFTT